MRFSAAVHPVVVWALLCFAMIAPVRAAIEDEDEPAPSPVSAVRTARGVRFVFGVDVPALAYLELAPAKKEARVTKRRVPLGAGKTAIEVPAPPGPLAWTAKLVTRTYGAATRVGTLGRGEEQFTNPGGIALGDGGRIYVADTGNDRIEVLSDRHTFLYEFGGFSGDSARFTRDEVQKFDEPTDLVQSINRDVYVVDRNNSRVVRIDRDGQPLAAFGTDAGLKLPRGIAANSRGEVLVADSGNDRVVIFDRDGHAQRTLGTFGWGPRQFKNPFDVTVDDENRIFVADTDNDRVQVFDNFGKLETIIKGPFRHPVAVRADGEGFVWVVDGRGAQLLKFTPDGRLAARIAAPQLPLEEPSDVAVTPEGHLYIADRAASTLWRVECGAAVGTLRGTFER